MDRRASGRRRWSLLRDARPIQTGADARGPQRLIVDEQPGRWQVRQIIDDPAGDHDWGISAEVDLAASDELGAAAVRVTRVGLVEEWEG